MDGYRLLCSCAKGGAEYKITEITEHTIRNLQPHTAYNITIFSYLKGSYSKPQIYNFTTLPVSENINEEVHTPGPTICTVTHLAPNLTEEGSKLGPKCVIKRPTSELPVKASNSN